jgi:FKBP-type peptidyl-prolyl cis-trans isomerase
MKTALFSLALVLALALSGCPSISASGVTTIEAATFAPALGVDLAQSTKDSSGMYTRELTVGDGGTPVQAPSVVTMRYTGWLADGTQFDSNQTTGFQFTLGAGQVISGWDIGVRGMQVGGTRQLIIPPSLGYGASGYGPIPPDAILVFSVTLLSSP